MSLVKQSYVVNEDIVFDCYILILKIDNKVHFWFKGSDIARFLEYKLPHRAVSDHVAEIWRKPWHELIQNLHIQEINTPFNWQTNTVFITEPGLYALISLSRKPKAIKFQRWLYEDVLPTLRLTGAYDMKAHNGSSESQQVSVWEKEKAELMEKINNREKELLTLQMKHSNEIIKFHEELQEVNRKRELAISRLDAKISILTNSNVEITKNYTDMVNKNEKLQNQCTMFGRFLGILATKLGKQFVLSRENVTQYKELYRNVSNLAHRITPITTHLNTPYVVCYEYTMNDVTCYKVTRSQLRTVQTRERRMNAAHFKKRQCTEEMSSWEDTAVEVFRTPAANAVAFWNCAKMTFPIYFYGINIFDMSGNSITYMLEEEIRERYRYDIEREDPNDDTPSEFKKLGFTSEDDAVAKTLTPPSETRNKTIFMLNAIKMDLVREVLPAKRPRLDDHDVSPEEIFDFFKNTIKEGNSVVDISKLDSESIKNIFKT